jgi:hypothetical protein
MDDSKRCPRCGLTNPGTALRCDCGWDFQSQSAARSYVQPQGMSEAQRKDHANNQIVIGILLILGGTLVTAMSLQSSSGGGYIFYGVILVGVIRVFRGLAAR